jgi:hypothetical protein
MDFRVNEPHLMREHLGCNGFLALDNLKMKDDVADFKKSITTRDDKNNVQGVKSGVVGIVSQYGSGKSFFLNILYCMLNTDNLDTVYIDMSKYEHDKDILKIVLISILKETKIRSSFREMAKSLLPSVSKLFVQSVLRIDDDTLKDIGGDIGKFIVDITNEEEQLKNTLEKHTKESPLVVIVDNLDRCRPEFVLYFLSTLKSIFNVNNILFVLAYDKKEMTNAIKTTYGSEVDIQSYLRKYIAAEYYIDRHTKSIKNFFNTYLDNLKDGEDNHQRYERVLDLIYVNSSISLRKVELLLKRFLNIVENNNLTQLENNERFRIRLAVLIFLYIKFTDDELYYSILIGEFNESIFDVQTTDSKNFLENEKKFHSLYKKVYNSLSNAGERETIQKHFPINERSIELAKKLIEAIKTEEDDI